MLLCHFAYNPELTNKPVITNDYKLNRRIWRNVNGGFKSVRGTPRRLARIIQAGHPYTATHGAYRHERHFIMGQTLSLDFDTGDIQSSFQHLLNDEFIKQHATFLYTTPSHTDLSPRSRVVFVLDEPVRSPKLYANMARALVKKYNQSDQTCKDPARIFFGSKDCSIEWLGNRMKEEALGGMLKELQEMDDAEEKRRKNFVPSALSKDTVHKQINAHLTSIVNAPDGRRHERRLAIAKLVGGFVAAGYVDLETAYNSLLDAAMQNTDSPEMAIERDIRSGLRSGLSSPVELRKESLDDWGIQLPE